MYGLWPCVCRCEAQRVHVTGPQASIGLGVVNTGVFPLREETKQLLGKRTAHPIFDPPSNPCDETIHLISLYSPGMHT